MSTEMDNADVAVCVGGFGLEMVRLVSFRDIRHTYASYIRRTLRWGGKRECCAVLATGHTVLKFSRVRRVRGEGVSEPLIPESLDLCGLALRRDVCVLFDYCTV